MAMEQPMVSVIIPIYNVEDYLEECIRSVCDQSYTNLEIILVDDGSPDGSPAICDAWAKKDSRIRVIHKKNGGLSDARNAGLDVAEGEYIYFVDGDDYIKPDLIETALGHFKENTDMVVFRYEQCREDGSRKAVAYYQLGEFSIDSGNRLHFLTHVLLAERIGWQVWDRVFRHDIIRKYNLRFADNRQIFAEDMYFCLCYCAHAENIVSIGRSLYCYRIRENSIMGRDGVKLNVGRMNALAKAVLEHLSQWQSCKQMTEQFYLIYFGIMHHILMKALAQRNEGPSELRQRIWDDIDDKPFFRNQMRQAFGHPLQMRDFVDGAVNAERISFYKYLLDGHYLGLQIRNRILYACWDWIEKRSVENKRLRKVYKRLGSVKKRIFLLGTEEYGNVGDHKINEAVIQFLGQVLPEHTVHEVTAPRWAKEKAHLLRCIRRDELIVFAGGGNFGDVYPTSQNIRDEVVKLWPNNPKIVFPQTIFFSEKSRETGTLLAAREIYTYENHVALVVREQGSYAFAKENFACEVELVPDIVLFCNEMQAEERNEHVLLCLRSDLEKALDSEAERAIEALCEKNGQKVAHFDLQLEYSVQKQNRKMEIDRSLQQFRQAKVVITDRLHGMIFAAITGTPCIALGNYNHKVSGVYEWIRYLPYIRFAETAGDVERQLPQLLAMEGCVYDNSPLLPHFEKLAQVVRKYANDQRDRSGL